MKSHTFPSTPPHPSPIPLLPTQSSFTEMSTNWVCKTFIHCASILKMEKDIHFSIQLEYEIHTFT